MGKTPKNDITQVLAKLTSLGKSYKSNGTDKYICQCPGHADDKPSLQVTKDGDKVLFTCFTGCSYRQITTALGFENTNRIHEYKDQNGKRIFYKEKSPDKQFRYCKDNGSLGIGGIDRPLYRQETLSDCKDGNDVFILESEKGADDLTCSGLKAVSTGGVNGWRPEYAPLFEGRRVVLLPHNDKAGEKLTKDITDSLRGIAESIKIVMLDGLPPGEDVSYWLQKGNTIEDLLLRIVETKQVKGNVSLKSMADVKDKALVWFWDDKIPDNGVSMIQGDPGVSKSFLTIFMAAHVSNGESWPDCPDVEVEKGSVLIVSGEDAEARIKERCRWMGADMSKIFIYDGAVQLDIREHLGELQTALDGLKDKCRLIVFDPITAVIGDTKANSNEEVRMALELLSKFAEDNELCIININHMNKKQGEKHVYRGLGSMGFTAVARSVWGIIWDESDEDHETRLMCPVKTNYSKHPSGLKYQIVDDAIVFQAEPYYGSIDEESGKAKEPKETKAEKGAQWLRDELAAGPVAQKTIEAKAVAAGFKDGTLWRAKKLAGVKSDKASGAWFWSIGL